MLNRAILGLSTLSEILTGNLTLSSAYWFKTDPEELKQTKTDCKPSKKYGNQSSSIKYNLNFPLQEFITNWIDELLGVRALLLSYLMYFWPRNKCDIPFTIRNFNGKPDFVRCLLVQKGLWPADFSTMYTYYRYKMLKITLHCREVSGPESVLNQ